MTAATPGQPAHASPHLGCAVCASGVTVPHGAGGTPGQAAFEAHERLHGSTRWRDTWKHYDNDEHEIWEAVAKAGHAAIAAQEPHAAPELAIDLDADVTEEQAAEIRKALEAVNVTRAAVAPELGTAWRLADERRELAAVRAEVIEDMLSRFGPSGSGHTARVGQVQIAKWRTRAGLTS